MQKDSFAVALAGVVAGSMLTVALLILFQITGEALAWAKANPTPIATVLSAILGFAGVAWATRAGFRNLIASQESQSKRDSESRQHQARLDRKRIVEELEDARQSLASSLSGELTAAHTTFENAINLVEVQIAMFESFGDIKPAEKIDILSSLPKFEPRIFKANIERIGILGPSTVSDVVEVYQMLLIERKELLLNFLNYKQTAEILKSYIKMMRNWQLDEQHVQHRLLAIFGTLNDPGPLSFARKKRNQNAPA